LTKDPPFREDTYRWRGDLGILDRFAYADVRQLPRNWGMTTMDAAQIELRNQSHSNRIQASTVPLLTDGSEGSNERMDNIPVSHRPQESDDALAEIPKKKR